MFRIASTLVLYLAATSLAAEDFEPIPTSPEEQLRIFHELAAKNGFSVYDTDEAGNIVFLGFNHAEDGRHRGTPDEQRVDNRDRIDELPGIRDEDMRLLLHFPELEALAMQFVPVTDEGYAVLQAFPQMRAINLSNLKHGWPEDEKEAGRAATTSQVFRYLDGMRDLRYWNTTHSFGFNDEPDVLHELQGFPELRYLNVDVGHSDDFEELFPFIQESPKIRHLKLHRCPFSDEQMSQIFAALPELERLDMKPAGNTPGKNWSYQSLAMLKDYPNLHYLRLIHAAALPLPWENGLEHLVEATNITHIEFPLKGKGEVRVEDIRRLMEARPDLEFVNLPEELLPEGVDHRDHKNRVRSEMDVDLSIPWEMGIGPG